MRSLASGRSATAAALFVAATFVAHAGAQEGDASPPDGLAAAEAALYVTSGSFRFANGRDARDLPFELNSDKIYVRARLNGQGPFWLMLDTGSPGMVLDLATAERLGLAPGPTSQNTRQSYRGRGSRISPLSPSRG